MKAVVISKTGGPEVLEIKDIKLNDPKSGEVLIKNEAIGLNYIDTYHRSGLYPIELPSNIGIEGAGVIEKIGPDVKDFKIGDRVAYASLPLGSYSRRIIAGINNLEKLFKLNPVLPPPPINLLIWLLRGSNSSMPHLQKT